MVWKEKCGAQFNGSFSRLISLRERQARKVCFRNGGSQQRKAGRAGMQLDYCNSQILYFAA